MQHSALEAERARWLDRLWGELFAQGEGLLSPREIRIEKLDRARIRAAELASIEAAEREHAQLYGGQLRDVSGQLVDAAAARDIPMFSFIERAPLDDDQLLARVSRTDHLLNRAADDAARQELLRSFNLQRIAMLAESEIHALPTLRPIGDAHPGAQWLQYWRQLARLSFAPALQGLWARVLVHEVAAPGRFPLAVLDTMARIGERELPSIRLLASYSFREFIFDARDGYFDPALHDAPIKTAADLGLLRADGKRVWLKLKRRPMHRNPQLLICNNRALQICQLPEEGVSVPVLRISAVGKQIFRLCDVQADMAYLLDMGAYVRARGAELVVGDWDPRQRRFDKRLDIA